MDPTRTFTHERTTFETRLTTLAWDASSLCIHLIKRVLFAKGKSDVQKYRSVPLQQTICSSSESGIARLLSGNVLNRLHWLLCRLSVGHSAGINSEAANAEIGDSGISYLLQIEITPLQKCWSGTLRDQPRNNFSIYQDSGSAFDSSLWRATQTDRFPQDFAVDKCHSHVFRAF